MYNYEKNELKECLKKIDKAKSYVYELFDILNEFDGEWGDSVSGCHNISLEETQIKLTKILDVMENRIEEQVNLKYPN